MRIYAFDAATLLCTILKRFHSRSLWGNRWTDCSFGVLWRKVNRGWKNGSFLKRCVCFSPNQREHVQNVHLLPFFCLPVPVCAPIPKRWLCCFEYPHASGAPNPAPTTQGDTIIKWYARKFRCNILLRLNTIFYDHVSLGPAQVKLMFLRQIATTRTKLKARSYKR